MKACSCFKAQLEDEETFSLSGNHGSAWLSLSLCKSVDVIIGRRNLEVILCQTHLMNLMTPDAAIL